MLVPESSRLTDLGVDVETIDKARLAASRQLREAIGARYVLSRDPRHLPRDGAGR